MASPRNAVAADEAAPRSAEGDVSRRARQRYEEGRAAYARGDYEGAVTAFRASFELVSSPALLFNIAQALRLAGRCPEALDNYRKFRESGATLPSDFEELRSRAEACAAEPPAPGPSPQVAAPSALEQSDALPASTAPEATAPKSADTRPTEAAAPPQKTAATSKPVRGDDEKSTPWKGIACLGVSLGSGVAGTLFALKANTASDHTSERSKTPGAAWDAEAEQNEADGKHATAWAAGLFATSALSATVGLWLLLGSDGSTSYRAGITTSPSGVSGTFGAHF
jgi:hypothetical protein